MVAMKVDERNNIMIVGHETIHMDLYVRFKRGARIWARSDGFLIIGVNENLACAQVLP